MGKVILIASGKGGVGKTTLAANLGIAIAKSGKDTVLVDNDIGLRNLDLALGLENNVFYDVVDVINEDCKMREATLKYEESGKLSFIPASQFKDDFVIDSKQYSSFIDRLKEKYEYIIIDCPAGIGDNLKNAAFSANTALIIVNPDPYSLRDADKLASLLEKYENIKDVRLVVNRMRKELVNKGVMLNIDNIIEALGIRLAGLIFEDSQIIEASIKGVPVINDAKSKSGKAFEEIAKRLLGENIPIEEITPKKRFWFF